MKVEQQRKIIHIDMDCFYAQVEQRDNPNLKNKPVAVGGSPYHRGVIATCNYVARKYGIHSAMASKTALHLCPDLVLIPAHFDKYRSISQTIRKIFHQYTQLVEPISLDEAFLDITHCTQQHNSGTLIAQEIMQKIYQSVQLTASAGVAPNKFLAKIASDWLKPNGLFTIAPTAIKEFVKPLPIRKIMGIGPVTEAKLHHLKIYTCQDLQQYSELELYQLLGKFGNKLFTLCRGIDHRPVQATRMRKSLSVEETFSKDINKISLLFAELELLYQELHARLKKTQQLDIYKAFVKIKFSNFKITTIESLSTQPNVDYYKKLCQEAYERHKLPVRLIGAGVRFCEKNKKNIGEKQLSLDLPEYI